MAVMGLAIEPRASDGRRRPAFILSSTKDLRLVRREDGNSKVEITLTRDILRSCLF